MYDPSNINSHTCVSEWIITKVRLVDGGGRHWKQHVELLMKCGGQEQLRRRKKNYIYTCLLEL